MTSKAEGRTVLVVDDHADIRELISWQLQTRGCNVVEAGDGKEAVELAPRVHPDLILMDLSMPVMDGYEATRRIHEGRETGDIPIVAVSAFCDPQNRQKAIEAGCVECVGKPLDFGLIDRLLRTHLRVH
jgi:CheY-like chemotaxis protein